MKKGIAIGLLFFSVAVLFSCATNTGTGASIGAGLGALAGQVIGGDTKATLIGAGIGAFLGGMVGNYIDDQTKTRQQSIQDIGYNPAQGNIVRIDTVNSEPLSVKRGETVGLKTTYYIISPNPNTMVDVKETRVIKYGGQPISKPIERISCKKQGNSSSIYQFKIPLEAQTGEYEVVTTIDNGITKDTGIAKFYIQSV